MGIKILGKTLWEKNPEEKLPQVGAKPKEKRKSTTTGTLI